jgi:hypothetical protein
MQVSRPEDVARETRDLELPRPQGGKTLVFKIRALSKGEWMVAQGDCPTIFRNRDENTMLSPEEHQRLIDMARRIAEAAVVAPPLAFDHRESGKVFWDDVLSENQDALTEGVAIFSGFARKPTGEAEKIATFPAGEAPGGEGSHAPLRGKRGAPA